MKVVIQDGKNLHGVLFYEALGLFDFDYHF